MSHGMLCNSPTECNNSDFDIHVFKSSNPKIHRNHATEIVTLQIVQVKIPRPYLF